jgi:glycerol-3-phosphate dehydrogenase (NAD(P)+)
MTEQWRAEGAVAVLGAGSWGTALAHLIAAKGVETRLWGRSAANAQALTQSDENAKYLRGTHLDNIAVTPDLAAATQNVRWVVSAVPCAAVPELALSLRGAAFEYLVSGTKGLHAQSGLRPSEMWQEFGGVEAQRFVALSGPNLAKEIAAGIPSSTVVASRNPEAAASAQALFASNTFRVYSNEDILGVELGGALKNVVAIAAGIGDGLGFGDNAKAALMTRAWREMTRLAMACGALESTLFGLSGMGDLIATCVSPHSRNRTLGEKLGRGESLGAAQHDIAQVAEGVHTARAALQLARSHRLELPVTEQIAAVLFENRSPREAVESLMGRAGCHE